MLLIFKKIQYYRSCNFYHTQERTFMKFNFKDKNEYIRIIKFGFVGIFNTAIDWLVFFILNTLITVTIEIAQPIAYACGVISSYVGNKFFTFKSKEKYLFAETTKFVFINLLSLGVSTLIITLLVKKAGWNEYIAKIPATIFAMALTL